jgi:hypothetical protein
MNKLTDTEKGLRELFKHAFLANCHLDNFEVTDEEHQALKSISPANILEGFKELILALLKFKKQTTETFNSYKQKIFTLEQEAKNSSKIEKSLKDHITFLKEKLRESEEKVQKLGNFEGFSKNFKNFRSSFEDEANFTLHKRYVSACTGKKFDCEGFVNGLSESFCEIEKPLKIAPDHGILKLKEKLKEKSNEISRIQDQIREKIYARDRPASPQVRNVNGDELSCKNQENQWDVTAGRSVFNYTRGSSESKFNKRSN